MRLFRGAICDRFLRFKVVGDFTDLALAYVKQPLNNCEEVILDGRPLGNLPEGTVTQIIYDPNHNPFCIRFASEEDAMHFLFQFKPK